ncbi:MAG: sulfatase-like hydrolase/transferase [bacterium]|nr:sulfatase-like hydrolase/transferase [bacterium]
MTNNSRQNYPNILWIGVDQMRADSLSSPICQTPNLDRLVQESVNFTRAYSPSSLCTPARGSMFTGLYAFKHGMGTNCDMYHALAKELPHPEQLLHTHLQNLGYRCGFTGKWHVGTKLGPVNYGFEGLNVPGYGDLRQEPGFQRYLAEHNLSYGPINDPIYANHDRQTLMAGKWNGPLESTPTYYLTNTTLDLLDDFSRTYKEEERPFFLTCQFWAPHGPYLPSPEYIGRHDRRAIPEWLNWQDDYRGKPRRLSRFTQSFFRKLPATWPEWQELIGLAYDYTTLVDEQIGRLLTRLEEMGLKDDTVIFFTSDHGDLLGSHGLHDKGFMYEEAHRIPLTVRLPGRQNGSVSDALVYNMDIMPTIFDLLDENLGDAVDGQSLLPFLDGNTNAVTGRDALYLEFHGIRFLHTQRGFVTRDGYKYLFNPDDDDELYDLNNDPGELDNLLANGKYHPRIYELREQLISLARRYDDPVQDCIAKWFGQWRNYSGQPDVSSAYPTAGH